MIEKRERGAAMKIAARDRKRDVRLDHRRSARDARPRRAPAREQQRGNADQRNRQRCDLSERERHHCRKRDSGEYRAPTIAGQRAQDERDRRPCSR